MIRIWLIIYWVIRDFRLLRMLFSPQVILNKEIFLFIRLWAWIVNDCGVVFGKQLLTYDNKYLFLNVIPPTSSPKCWIPPLKAIVIIIALWQLFLSWYSWFSLKPDGTQKHGGTSFRHFISDLWLRTWPYYILLSFPWLKIQWWYLISILSWFWDETSLGVRAELSFSCDL